MFLAAVTLCCLAVQDAPPPLWDQDWTLIGVVRSSDGQALPGALVRAGDGPVLEGSLTDSEGRFRVESVRAEGSFTGVRVSAEGHHSLHVRNQLLTADDGIEEDFEFVLAAHRPVRGRIVDGNGQPLAGVRVTLSNPEYGTAVAEEPSAADGSYVVPHAALGVWRAQVAHPELHAGLLMQALVQGGETDALLFAFTRSKQRGRLRVQARDMAGNPFHHTEIGLELPGRAGMPNLEWTQEPNPWERDSSDPNWVEFDAPFGDWLVCSTRSHGGFRSFAKPVTLGPNNPVQELGVTMLPGAEYTFVAQLETEDGTSYPDGPIWVRSRPDLTSEEWHPAGRIQQVLFGQLTLPLLVGPNRLEIGGVGPQFERRVDFIRDQEPPVLRVPLRGSIRLVPEGAPRKTTPVLRLWRPGAKERPVWLTANNDSRSWPRLGLEPGAWRWRLEFIPDSRYANTPLQALVLEDQLEIVADAPPRRRRFTIPAPTPLN